MKTEKNEKEKKNQITEWKQPSIIPCWPLYSRGAYSETISPPPPPSIHAELSIRKKGRISRRNGKRRPEYSKAALYDVLQSHHDPRLSFLEPSNSFRYRTEQFL